MRNHDAGIHIAGQERFDLHIAGGLAQQKLHIGPRVAKVPQQGGQDAVIGGADEGQRQRADLAARQPLREPGQCIRLRESRSAARPKCNSSATVTK